MSRRAADCARRSGGLAAAWLAAALGLAGENSPGRERIEDLVREAENLTHFEAFAPALARLEEALRASEALRDTGLVALCLDRMGLVFDFQGDLAEGRQRHERALSGAREAGDRELEASVLASIGLAHWRRSEYDAALDRLREALSIQEELHDAAGAARTLVFTGRAHFKSAAYGRARESYLRALALQQGLGDRRGQSITLEDLADLSQEQGAYAEALELYGRSLLAREQIGDRAGECYVLHLVGRCYMLQGAYRAAFAWYERALELARQIDDAPGRALALYHIGIAYERQGEAQTALAHYAEALELKERLGDRRQQAWILRRMGDAHLTRGDVESALRFYERAIQAWNEIQDWRGMADGLERAARLCFEVGRHEQALDHYERAERLLATAQPAFLAPALAHIGKIHAARGDRDRALEYGRRAAESARGIGNEEVQWAVLSMLGWIDRRLGRREEALASYRESLEVIEKLRARVVASEETRSGFLESKQAAYAETIDLLMELGRYEEALEVSERARARAFLDLLSGREVEAKPADREALTRIRRLQDELRRSAGPEAPAERLAAWELDRGHLLRSELEALVAERPELASLVTAPAVTLAQVRKESRRAGATLVEYFSAKDRLFIWVVTPEGEIHPGSANITRRDLTALVGTVRRAMRTDAPARGGEPEHESDGDATRGPGPVSRSPAAVRRLLRRMHRILVEPVERFLPQDSRSLVTIIPHGPLFLISFASFLDGKGKYFLERHTLSYSPSVGVLRYTERKRLRVIDSERPQLLVVGNPAMPRPPGSRQPLPPLPGAEAEVRSIRRLYPGGQVTALSGTRAREATVRELVPGQTILHLATHAMVFDDEPLGSFLALAPDPKSPEGDEVRDAKRDGLLTVAEVFGLDLHAGLVTLSACNTGLGPVNGDGVIGLSRAFLYAGTASVMVSLWRVADAVARFQMERFYAALIRDGGDKASALRQAQLETIGALRGSELRAPSGRPLPEDPLLWAPFVLVGEAR